MKFKINRYRKFFKENNVIEFLKQMIGRLGQKSAYSMLLLFYAYKNNDTPLWAKNIIIGVIGYVLAPLDGIPDLTPFLGFTDDMGVIAFGLVTIACYIDTEVREKAKLKMSAWFKSIDENLLLEVDKDL